MLDLGLIGFTQPWLLVAAAALPALWLLLRITPPAPRKVLPGAALPARPEQRERTPARTPLWLLLLRLGLAALLILALAGPILNPAPRLAAARGPLVLAIDNGWAAAPGWGQRVEVGRELIQQAGREGREVVLLPTAPVARPQPLALDAGGRGHRRARLARPRALAGRPRRRRPAAGGARPQGRGPGLAQRRPRRQPRRAGGRRPSRPGALPPRAAQDLRRPAGRAGRPAAPARRQGGRRRGDGRARRRRCRRPPPGRGATAPAARPSPGCRSRSTPRA